MSEQSLEDALAAIRENLVGKPVNEAKELCEQHGWSLRCRNRDGKSLIGTADFRTDRVNYVEVGGVVTEVIGIG